MNRQDFEDKYKHFTINDFKRKINYPKTCHFCERDIQPNEKYYNLLGNTVNPYATFCIECYNKLKEEYDENR